MSHKLCSDKKWVRKACLVLSNDSSVLEQHRKLISKTTFSSLDFEILFNFLPKYTDHIIAMSDPKKLSEIMKKEGF